jgi:hypothetical protein
VLDGRCTFIAQPATDMWGVGVIMYQLVTGAQRLKRNDTRDGSLLARTSKHTEMPDPLYVGCTESQV